MLNTVKWFAIAAALLALSACGTQLEKAESMTPGGGAFNQALHKYYVVRAGHEYGYGNYVSSDRFADKALAASSGDNVLPDEVSAHAIPQNQVSVMDSARGRLMAALDGGGRDAAADDAAMAQVQLDCWLEELAEGRQPTHIEDCKQMFFAALRKVEAAIAPEPAAAVAPAPAPKAEAADFVVYFDFDKADIRADQDNPLQVATLAAQSAGDRTITLTCHTDTAGNVDYNQALSVRRCNTVTGHLIDAGIDRSRIIAVPVGQTQPLVDTGDGVAEQGNRVVAIRLEAE